MRCSECGERLPVLNIPPGGLCRRCDVLMANRRLLGELNRIFAEGEDSDSLEAGPDSTGPRP